MEELDLSVSKYDRAERITWWDQAKLLKSKVLIVGAGALGNEIVKNLALVGVGKLTIVDMDLIERTNLARCIFFRESDNGSPKSEVLAREAMRLNSDITTNFYTCPVQELGDAFFLDFDLIIAGLDNREARVWLGSAAKRVGKTWIDGAIEGLMGKVQTFTPEGPCYACTMGENDWELIQKRKSCKLLGDDEILMGHTPTNATTSSIIAGIQSQEAIKYLVGKPELAAIENKVWRMIGEQMSTFFSIVDIDEDCPYHFANKEITSIFEIPNRLAELWSMTNQDENATLVFSDDFLLIKGCPKCTTASKLGWADLLKGQGKCSTCSQILDQEQFNRVELHDEITKIALVQDFWPLKCLIDFQSEILSSRHVVTRSI